MNIKKSSLALLAGLFVLVSCSSIPRRSPEFQKYYESLTPAEQKLFSRMDRFAVKTSIKTAGTMIPYNTVLDSLSIDKGGRSVTLYYSRELGYRFYREDTASELQETFKKALGWKFRRYRLTVMTGGSPLTELVPNLYRSSFSQDEARKRTVENAGNTALVRNLSRPYEPENGLQNRHIALWHSHGWYYANKQKRWEWERPRLWQTVEDLYPLSYTIPFLVPMLENAGANVFLPRERDFRPESCVVDNDDPNSQGRYLETGLTTRPTPEPGYTDTIPVLTDQNPFRLGSAVEFTSVSGGTGGRISWQPRITFPGNYAVYISYVHGPDNVRDARYTVHHLGGSTEFSVDQTMGGSTWIYLGTFAFSPNSPAEKCSVTLNDVSETPGKRITADAVRFGGGMGNIARDGRTSRRARFYEASRYYLQYSGMPDTLVWSFHEDTLDYNDDYKSRGEWVSYLMGAPNGPNADNSAPGLNIPIDLSLAFHTDAGTTDDQSTIGTLAIFSSMGMDDSFIFPDGRPRIAGRDLADIMQTQIVSDIRRKYDPRWSRRAIMNSTYSEATRPNAPSLILELLSHQNFQDMKFGLDPAFRFDVSRSIYKSMLRFIAGQDDNEPVVQPLPVSHFRTEWVSSDKLKLRWKATKDPLESTARPDAYIVYTRPEGGDFNNGTLVEGTSAVISNLQQDKIYSFKVTALNAGGESFPSEILSACMLDNDAPTALVINAFDRISGPAWQEHPEFSGFLNYLDEGVPYGIDHSFVGRQFDFDPKSNWRTNDIPGHGSSFADMETHPLAGNTFDYTVIHGSSLRAAGYSYASISDECVEMGTADLENYELLDLIGGEEKYTPMQISAAEKTFGPRFVLFTPELVQKLRTYLENGGKLLVTGAYAGSDPLFYSASLDSAGFFFVKDFLGIRLARTHASVSPGLFSENSTLWDLSRPLEYNTVFSERMYRVEAPDEINPALPSAETVLRFDENHFSCGVVNRNGIYSTLTLSIPFETITGSSSRDALMKGAVQLLNQPPPAEKTDMKPQINKSSRIDP